MNDKNTGLYGSGRRKTSVAQVLLQSDSLDRTVNGKKMEEYFTTVNMQSLAMRPLVVSSQHDVFGFKAKIKGGGKNSQAEALSLAIARALVGSDESYRKQLRKSGLMTRDPRAKERKKPGLKRARRAPQFSKR